MAPPPAQPAYALDAYDIAEPDVHVRTKKAPAPPRHTAQDYWDLPEGSRTELVNGAFYCQAAPSRTHQRLVGLIYRKLSSHIEAHGGGCETYVAPFATDVNADGSVILEPDVLVVCDPAKLSERCCTGAPDFVAEVVSPSGRTRDYLTKAALYCQAGVREYWIVDPMSRKTTVYRFDAEADWLDVHPFDQPCPVALFEGLAIRMDDAR